ncbi:MAG: hypothetical protein JKY65_00540, partial [Planctomycetes bacterium]|nr:hypothetical protein [Planctomycetota bacterium]
MPIQYVCVGCRQPNVLPDQRAGQLSACMRCGLKFLAPAPNMPQAGAGGPPLYAAPVTLPQDAEPKKRGSGMFGLDSQEASAPAGLFGEEEVKASGLFGEAGAKEDPSSGEAAPLPTSAPVSPSPGPDPRQPGPPVAGQAPGTPYPYPYP